MRALDFGLILAGLTLLAGPLVSAALLVRHAYFAPVSRGLHLAYYWGMLGLGIMWTTIAAGATVKMGWRLIAFAPMLLMVGLTLSYWRVARNFRIPKVLDLLIMLSISWLVLGGLELRHHGSLLPW